MQLEKYETEIEKNIPPHNLYNNVVYVTGKKHHFL